jgi:hypothetical protein
MRKVRRNKRGTLQTEKMQRLRGKRLHDQTGRDRRLRLQAVRVQGKKIEEHLPGL